MKIGTFTKFGTVDSVTVLGDGVTSFTTPRHGGIKLDAKRNKLVHEAWRREGGLYEEDVDWAIVAVTPALSPLFRAEDVAQAHKIAKSFRPDAYEKVFGVKVELEESIVLQDRAAQEAAKDKLVSFCAFGSWHANVPEGKVGVIAKVGGREGEGDIRCFLVPEAEYDARGRLFIVDPTRHEELARNAF